MTTAAAEPNLGQKLGAEAIGTAVLVLMGCGAVAATAMNGGDYAAVGLAFGIAIVAMVYAFGRVSGGHFNPAVSVGAALGGRISWREAGAYVGAQVVGGLVGGLLLALIILAGDTGWEFGDSGLGANGFGDHGGVGLGGALIVEIVMTFIFLTVILAVTDVRNEHPALAPLAIGLTLAGIHFASIGMTGTSVNPARSIAVAFFSGGDAIAQLWLFIVAPLVGAALAGLAYPALFGHGSEPVAGSGFNFGGQAAPGYGTPDALQQQWNQPEAGGFGGGHQWGQQQHQQQWSDPNQGQHSHQGHQGHQGQQQAEQPIIQDGWQWDPQAQQWIPAQQPDQGNNWGGNDAGGDRTQIRPGD